MKEFKSIFQFSMLSVKDQLRNIGFYIVLLVVFFVIQFICYDIGDYLHATNDKMNIFEIYIWFLSIRNSQIIYLAGLVFVICGCSFFSNGAAYGLIRMKRKTWVASHIFYLLTIVAIYNISLIVFFWISCKGAITVKGIWSNAAYVAGQFWIEDIGIRSMMDVNYSMLSFNPNYVGILTFVLSLLIGLIVGMIMLAFMLCRKSVWGIACIVLLWFMDMLLVERFNIEIFRKILPFSLSRSGQLGFCYSGPPVIYAIAYFILFTIVMIAILEKISQKVDFVKME